MSGAAASSAPATTSSAARSPPSASPLRRLLLRDGHERRPVYLEPVAELGEAAPARVDDLLIMRVRLVVQVPAADRAQARAVGAAEDLVRERERGRVPRPAREVEAGVDDVLGRELLGVARA